MASTQNNWYVLTGGPGSGKTTLLAELRKHGFNTVKEAARYHIETQLAAGSTLEKIRASEKKFQEEVFEKKQIVHDSLDTEVVTFFDRGLHDTLAYMRYFGYEIENYILKASRVSMYNKVFILDMLPYHKDEARTEDETIAHALQSAIIAAYKKSRHDLVHVPVMPLQDRVEFVLKNM